MTEQQILSLVRQYGTMDKALEGMPEVELRLSDGQMYGHKGKLMPSVERLILKRERLPCVLFSRILKNAPKWKYSDAYLPLREKDVFVIPQEATFEIQDKVYVYKVNKEGKAESAQVTVFPQNNGTEYVVESGLQQGETIVAEGAGLIQENTQVTAASPEKSKERRGL